MEKLATQEVQFCWGQIPADHCHLSGPEVKEWNYFSRAGSSELEATAL